MLFLPSFSLSLSFHIFVLHSILFLPSSTSLFFLFYFPSPSLFSHFPTSLYSPSFFIPPRHSSLYLLSTSSSSMYTILPSPSLPPFVSSLFLLYLTLFPSSLLRLYSSQILSLASSLFFLPPSSLFIATLFSLSLPLLPHLFLPPPLSPLPSYSPHIVVSLVPLTFSSLSLLLFAPFTFLSLFLSPPMLAPFPPPPSSLPLSLSPLQCLLSSLSRFTWSLFFPSCQPLIPSSSLPPISPLPTLPFLPSFSHQIFTSFFFP